ncbi:hypothetical protein GCM10007874_62140 [Labrys miyagiensis]|uniref:Type II toxin-antitoxin system RelE/ParE family toxin n=1 Tax=Labrys miyagiensis TaxID=346912 RepID=A0ABQ6CTZ1_9HYPH|nr:hypothetical protein GCM10007874_62140 [Labrys miyagiensis]
MPHLVWSPRALSEVSRLHRFLASKNPNAAKRAVAAIRQGVRLLSEQPEIGRLIDDHPVEIREWPIGFGAWGYIVRYRYAQQSIVILAVRAGREAGF